jgi:hypothetical protein
MKRFLYIFLFLFLIHMGHVFVILSEQMEGVVAQYVLEEDGYSDERYSDYDSPCGVAPLNVPAPAYSFSERGGGSSNFANSRRAKISSFTHGLIRYDKLLNRHYFTEFGNLLSCQLSGVRSPQNRLFFLCALKS